MRKTILVLIILMVVSSLLAIDESELMSSDEYIWGRGEAEDYEVAEQTALTNLSEQISVVVESRFRSQWEEINKTNTAGKEKVELNEYAARIVNTYSGSFLKETGRIFIPPTKKNKNYIVYKFIKRSEKDKLFASRKQRAEEFLFRGRHNREDLNINRALLDFYSGLLLITSHPGQDTIKVCIENKAKNLKMQLDQEIRETLAGITFESGNMRVLGNYKRINVQAYYKGATISNLRYCYFDGNDQIEGNILDGMGRIDLVCSFCEAAEEIQVKIDYGKGANRQNKLMDPELKALNGFIYTADYTNQKMIELPGKERAKPAKIKYEEAKEFRAESKLARGEKKSLKNIMDEVIESLRKDKYDDVREYFTKGGYEQFRKLTEYGEISIYEEDFTIQYLNLENQVQVRSVPVVYKLNDVNKKVVVEKLCFIYEDGRISWVNFALEDSYIDDAIERNEKSKDLQERLLGINFMEYYKTIFNTQEADLIADVFADSAKIFAGYVKRTEKVPENLQRELNNKLEHKVVMTEYTKEEYISHLKYDVFANNKYINIQFRDAELIKRSSTLPIYAIQMHQDYYSTTYSDQGYLLLFVDFSNKGEAKIFFRYWQEEQIGQDSLRAIKPGDVKW
ncbi:MAG: LPP20 family lipoprotein [Candidatus Cloacimonetes bacterium]|nr:LPP20 family lipoprotein [Candidatus Cloacimonadota bacterium]